MSPAQRDFYLAALVAGAHIALADGTPDSSELRQLKSYFEIDLDKLPEAATVYNGQLQRPQPLESALAPFLPHFRKNSELAETFLYGMCLITKSDGKIHPEEIKLLLKIAELIGLDRATTSRVLLSAKVVYLRDDDKADQPKKDSRTEHLAVLGLLSNATEEEIKEEYRRLTRRYHTDVLRSQGLPDAEVRHAEELLRKINNSYDWLVRKSQN